VIYHSYNLFQTKYTEKSKITSYSYWRKIIVVNGIYRSVLKNNENKSNQKTISTILSTMKKLYFHIFLLSFLFSDKKLNNSFTSDIHFFENEKKTAELVISKTHFFTSKSKKNSFKKDRYFEIVPPEYQLREDPLITFDTTINYEAMKYNYELIQETVWLEQGGWKWKIGKTNSKKSKTLKFEKEDDKYLPVIKAVFTHGYEFRENTKKEILEYHLKKAKKAKAIVEAGRMNKIITWRECIKDGYLKEIPFTDLRKFNFSESQIIKFRKGSWTLLKPKLSELDSN